MRSIELRQKILLIRLAGQLLLLNGNQTKERVFLSILLRIILSGISLANYINGLQIHMLSCHCKNWKTDWMRISTLFMQWLILWVMKNYLNHIWENGLTKQLKQLSGKYTNSYMLIQLLRSEPLEPRLENGKRLHYNFPFIKPFERGEIFSQRAFSIFTDIRKLQEKAETSYTLITEEVEVLIWVIA